MYPYQSPTRFLIAAVLIAFTADLAIAQYRGASRPISAAKPFGVQRGGLGITGPGPSMRASNRPSAYRSTYRSSQGFGGGNRSAVAQANGWHSRSGGRHYANSGRKFGTVPGFNVQNGAICAPKSRGSIIGNGGYPGSCYYPSYGFCGGYKYRYPIYSVGVWDSYGVPYYDYVEEDYYDSLGDDDYGYSDSESDAAWEARERAAAQSEALAQFGNRYGADTRPPAPPKTVMVSPQVAETSRQIGIALGRGDKAFEEGKYEQARDEYIRALVLSGEDASARIALGIAEYALGSHADAAQAIRKGVARAPSLATSEFDLRAVYGRQADIDTHRRVLEDHLAQQADDVDARFLLGFVLYFSGDRDGGKALLGAYLADAGHDDAVREFIETAKVAMPRSQQP